VEKKKGEETYHRKKKGKEEKEKKNVDTCSCLAQELDGGAREKVVQG